MRSGHASHANRAGKAPHATLRRDDDDEPMCIHRVDGNDFRESLLQLHVERRARVDGHHIVDLGPRLAEVERLENGSCPMVDLVDLDDGHRPRARIVSGEFAEGTFRLSHPGQNPPFQNIFRPPPTGRRGRMACARSLPPRPAAPTASRIPTGYRELAYWRR